MREPWGKTLFHHQQHEPVRILPHPRTLRKARENVKWMVNDGVSLLKTRNYLHRFVHWWANTSSVWQYEELLKWFMDACWEQPPAAIAAWLLQRATLRRTESSHGCCPVAA